MAAQYLLTWVFDIVKAHGGECILSPKDSALVIHGTVMGTLKLE